jgi:hypothetical protein
MDEFLVTLYIVAGILLRIAIPLGITVGASVVLRRLDKKWRKEADQQYQNLPSLINIWLENPCWELNECEETRRETCDAYQQADVPCWEVFQTNGHFNRKCKSCSYLKEMPIIPVKIKTLRKEL